MNIKKIAILLFCLFLFCASSFIICAADYSEYFEYSGVAISDTIASRLQGYAVNYMASHPYRYWLSLRVGEYQYLIAFFNDLEDYSASSVLQLDGVYVVYDEHYYSYTTGSGASIRTYYQAGFSDVYDMPVSVSLSRGYFVGNFAGTVAVNGSQTDSNTSYLKYILYIILIFLFLYIAFQFVKKRWFIQ